VVSKLDRDIHRLMDKPAVEGLPLKRHSAIGPSRGSIQRVMKQARTIPRNLRCPGIDEWDTGS